MYRYFYVGTYMGEFGGKGIAACVLNTDTGRMKVLGMETNCQNPNFLVMDSKSQVLCAVNEDGEKAWLSSYRIREDHTLDFLDQISIPGKAPCHLSMDAAHKQVFYADYESGEVGMVRLRNGGFFGRILSIVQRKGHSVDVRQREAHPHQVFVQQERNRILVPDLGTDEIAVYRNEGEKLVQQSSIRVRPGDGPRHLVFHPHKSYLYLLCEIENVIYVLEETADGKWKELERISLLGEDTKGRYLGGEIAVTGNGKYLLACTRGWGLRKEEEGKLLIFSILDSGRLEHKKTATSKGCHPRMFTLADKERFVLMANQYSGNLVSFRMNPQTGALAVCDEILLPGAACVISE